MKTFILLALLALAATGAEASGRQLQSRSWWWWRPQKPAAPSSCPTKNCFCPPGSTDCATCSCTECFPRTGFVNPANPVEGCAACTDPDCFKCSSRDTCTECAAPDYVEYDSVTGAPLSETQPFYLSDRRTCERCTAANCAVVGRLLGCDSAGFCKACAPGFGRASNTDKTCVPSTAANCEVPNPNNAATCVLCEPGYALIGGACKKCSVENCILCPWSVDVCRGCDVGYGLLADDICAPCAIEGCATCNGDVTTCSSCMAPTSKSFYKYDSRTKVCYKFSS